MNVWGVGAARTEIRKAGQNRRLVGTAKAVPLQNNSRKMSLPVRA